MPKGGACVLLSSCHFQLAHHIFHGRGSTPSEAQHRSTPVETVTGDNEDVYGMSFGAMIQRIMKSRVGEDKRFGAIPQKGK